MKVIQGYVHHDGSVGVLMEFECGSDFTSRTPEFKAFAERICMAVAVAVREEMLHETRDLVMRPDVKTVLGWEVPDGASTVGQAFAEAEKLFREKIALLRVSVLHT